MENLIPVKFYNLKKSGQPHHPIATTVGELKKILNELPDSLMVDSGTGCGIEVIVYNHGRYEECLIFDEISE